MAHDERHDERTGGSVARIWARGVGLGALALLLGAVAANAAPRSSDPICSSGKPAEADLGISRLACNCTLKQKQSSPDLWSFRTEPEILGVRDGGPAVGLLRKGDRVVAIDGLLITTPPGGRRWSQVRPGERVELRVRRGSGVEAVEMVVGSRCPETSLPSPASEEAEAGPSAHPESSDLAGAMEAILPRGWLGLGLSCHCTVQAQREGPRWTFYEPPRIEAIDGEGPAAASGVRPGDLLVAVDGHPLTDEAGAAAFSSLRPGQRVRLTVRRDGVDRKVELVTGERPE